jgi:hypothetical protein
MKLTPAMLTRAANILPGVPIDKRIVLDPGGIHHKTIPSASFEHSVANHANLRNRSVAESLFIVERLADMGVVGPGTTVQGQGAIFQAFSGTGGREACHSLHCQLLLDNQFPHSLRDPAGKPLNYNFVSRVVQLFARCTLQPKVVNAIDQVLDWHEDVDFVGTYKDAVRAVLDGNDPEDAFRDYTRVKAHTLSHLLEQVRDEPLTPYDAMLLMGLLTETPGSEGAMTGQELERRLTDKEYLGRLQSEREQVIETYADRDRFTPHEVITGELKTTVQNEPWADPD